MRILFASGEPYLPGSGGGAEQSVHALAHALLAKGHACEVLAGVARGGARRWHRAWSRWTRGRRLAREDARNGYPTHRAIARRVPDALRERLAAARPDLVVAWNRASADTAEIAAAAGLPSIVWIHDALFAWDRGALPATTRVAAVTDFVAERARERLRRPVDVLRPWVDLSRYRVASRHGAEVLLVNPRATKGVETALAVARRLPHRRFLFVGTRHLPREDRRRLVAARRTLANLAVVRHVADMRRVYARTALVLIPSVWEEAGPRVAVEAQASGIPVVARDHGGLAETCGAGASLLPVGVSDDAWAVEVERLLADPVARERLGALGRANAARAEFTEAAILAAFLRIAQEAREAMDGATAASAAADQ